MHEIIELLLDYARRNNIGIGGVSIEIHDDGSGCIFPYMTGSTDAVFSFDNESEFLEKIKK